MHRAIRLLPMLFLALSQPLFATAQDDYGYLWWAHGWRGASLEGQRVLCVQTNHYGLALDVHKPAILHLGAISNPKPYAKAVADSNDIVFDLPPADLALWVEHDGIRYTCAGAAGKTEDLERYPVRLVESGRVVQRFDIQQLVFESEAGEPLPAQGRLEVIAWPDALHFMLELTPTEDLETTRLGVELEQDGDSVIKSTGEMQTAAGESIHTALTWSPRERVVPSPAGATIEVRDTRSGSPVPARYDATRGWRHIDLPEATWARAEQPDRQDRFAVRITNPGKQAMRVPVNFAFDGKISGITGMTPILRDTQGRPAGIPIQISKNWHNQAGKTFLYEGPWFHGFTQIEVGPGETWEGELVLVYALWGGVPAASHAQLSLIGWGTNQRWDQVAIGSWGEMFCYDPDVNLNRSMIDDVRPLMVNGMRDNGPWQWTVNVGGGDFLVYFDEAGEKQYLSRMRAAYLEPGPNLTRTVYAGRTPRGELEARIEVSSPRCDDVSRAYHTFRYDVKKAMPFSRLAFYQLGADNYNDHQFTTLARGNEDGVIEEWEAPQGGKKYHQNGIPCEGAAPWFSLHGGQRNDHHPKGAWANRGLIIRKWKARLGGKKIPHPIAAIYGTENGVPSANVELVPPPGCTELLPGDYVEAEVEFVAIPADPDTYYGPNNAFKAHLEANIDTWKPVHRLAARNNLRIEAAKGTVMRKYPVEIATDKNGEAEFTMHGGAGYVPVTFTGLPARTGYILEGAGHDTDKFVQIAFDSATATWSRTYNVNMDARANPSLILQKTDAHSE